MYNDVKIEEIWQEHFEQEGFPFAAAAQNRR